MQMIFGLSQATEPLEGWQRRCTKKAQINVRALPLNFRERVETTPRLML